MRLALAARRAFFTAWRALLALLSLRTQRKGEPATAGVHVDDAGFHLVA
jgi:hypothetical protein